MTVDTATDIPIWETARLNARIAALDPERKQRLADAWTANWLPSLAGVETLDAETYRRIERMVDGYEPTLSGEPVYVLPTYAQRIASYPEPLRTAATDAISVYAGLSVEALLAAPLLVSTGRMAEVERIMAEAEAALPEVLATAAETPKVADLGPVPEPDVAPTSDLPSAKAKSDEVLAWVGEDRNRAARAYAAEHDRNSPRKGVLTKLRLILGPDGVAAVVEAMEAAVPPPLDLGEGEESGPTEAGESAAPAEEQPTATVPPAAPVEPDPPAFDPTEWVTPASDPTTAFVMPIADILERIGNGVLELAEAVRAGR